MDAGAGLKLWFLEWVQISTSQYPGGDFCSFLAAAKLRNDSAEWAKQWIKAGNCCLEKIGRVGRVDEPFAVHKKSVLLTYQGDFGAFDESLGNVPAWKDTDDAIHASSGLAMDLIHGNRSVLECTEQVVEVIKQQPRFQVLRASVDKHLDFLTEAWAIDHWAWSLELCTQSYLEGKDIRVHLHIFLFRQNGRVRTRNVRN